MWDVVRSTSHECSITPYFGLSWLTWLRPYARWSTQSDIDTLLEVTAMSNHVHAEFVDTTKTEFTNCPLNNDFMMDETAPPLVVMRTVIREILIPRMTASFEDIDPSKDDAAEFMERFRVMQHIKSLIMITGQVIEDTEARLGHELYTYAISQ